MTAPAPLPALTVLASDKPHVKGECRCSRCSDETQPLVVVCHWNEVEFWYCAKCRERMPI
jgi:hypothetical protein